MSTIGSILNASPEEIKIFCQDHDRFGSESDYLTRQGIALEDARKLKAINVTSKEIIDKLSALLEQASETTHQTIELDGDKYSLDDFPRRAKMEDICIFCEHNLSAPRAFTIQNCFTKDIVPIFESTLHDMKEHDYFGRPDTMYRIDPLLLCKVLQLGTEKCS